MERPTDSSHRRSDGGIVRVLGSTLLGAVTVVAGLLLPSCVSLFELDGYASATSELCEVLEQCYGAAYLGACQAYVSDRLDGASQAEREAWLVYFADHNCLGSCLNARRCLDERPLCAPQATACAQTEHCCGFSQGLGECGGSGSCCLPDGLECSADSECCASPCEAATCDGNRSCQVCGGTPCKLVGEACDNGFECCSLVCDPRSGTCRDDVCLENGVECEQNFECCSEYCAIPGGAAVGLCDEPSCLFDGASCSTAAECCNGHCIGIGGGARVCSSSSCRPDETACDDSEQCCSGYCDPDFGQCAQLEPCGQVGEPCDTGEDCCYPVCTNEAGGQSATCACKPEGEPCAEQFECCENNCSDSGTCRGNGSCLGYQEPCDPSSEMPTGLGCCSRNCGSDGTCCRSAFCTHSACKPGVPLKPDCLECDFCSISGSGDSCPGRVCANSAWAHCCCDEWSAACVAQAVVECGHVCPYAVPPSN